jgi:hypothetical protein
MDSFVLLLELLSRQMSASPKADHRLVLIRLLEMLEHVNIEDVSDKATYALSIVPALKAIAAGVPLAADVAAVCDAFAAPACQTLSQYGDAAGSSMISSMLPLKVLHFAAIYNVTAVLTGADAVAAQMREYLRCQAKGAAHTIFKALGSATEVDDYVKYGIDTHQEDKFVLMTLITVADCLRQGVPLPAPLAGARAAGQPDSHRSELRRSASCLSGDELDEKHIDVPEETSGIAKRRKVIDKARATGRSARIVAVEDSDSDDIHAPLPRRTHLDLTDAEHNELAAWLDEFYAKDLITVCQNLGIDIGYVKDDHIDSIIEALGWEVYTHPALAWRRATNKRR